LAAVAVAGLQGTPELAVMEAAKVECQLLAAAAAAAAVETAHTLRTDLQEVPWARLVRALTARQASVVHQPGVVVVGAVSARAVAEQQAQAHQVIAARRGQSESSGPEINANFHQPGQQTNKGILCNTHS
jgi:hypothetical protein